MTTPIILSGHQPTYLPWLGLFHKALLADVWVFEDFAQYQAKDWYNRNYVKTPQGRHLLTVPVDLRAGSIVPIKEVKLARTKWAKEHWQTIRFNYAKAPFFKDHAGFFEELYLRREWTWLAELNRAVLDYCFAFFGVTATFVVGSEQNYREKKSALNLEMCLRHGANHCVFGANGRDYVIPEEFARAGVKIYFQGYRYPRYPQRFGEYVSHLSALDLLFNCGPQSRELIWEGNVLQDDIPRLAT